MQEIVDENARLMLDQYQQYTGEEQDTESVSFFYFYLSGEEEVEGKLMMVFFRNDMKLFLDKYIFLKLL